MSHKCGFQTDKKCYSHALHAWSLLYKEQPFFELAYFSPDIPLGMENRSCLRYMDEQGIFQEGNLCIVCTNLRANGGNDLHLNSHIDYRL